MFPRLAKFAAPFYAHCRLSLLACNCTHRRRRLVWRDKIPPPPVVYRAFGGGAFIYTKHWRGVTDLGAMAFVIITRMCLGSLLPQCFEALDMVSNAGRNAKIISADFGVSFWLAFKYLDPCCLKLLTFESLSCGNFSTSISAIHIYIYTYVCLFVCLFVLRPCKFQLSRVKANLDCIANTSKRHWRFYASDVARRMT